MLTVMFFGRCIEFLAGMYLALLLLRGYTVGKGAKFTWLGIACMVVVIGAMAFVDTPGAQSDQRFMARVFLNNVALVPGVCSLFYGLVREQSIVSRLLASKPFDLFGKASYAFYLVHFGLLSQFLHFYVTQNVWLCFIAANLVAIALYKVIEHPIHRLLTARK